VTIDKQKLQSLLWSEVAAWKANCAEWKRNTEALQEFLGEKTVEEVALELLAENDQLKNLRSTNERDLSQELEVWRNGPSCWNCGDTGDVHDMVGEWRGQCDCNAAKLIDVSSERDQLKAENEALRKDAERYRWLQHGHSGYIEVVEWIGPHATGMTGEDLDALVDTAMSKAVKP